MSGAAWWNVQSSQSNLIYINVTICVVGRATLIIIERVFVSLDAASGCLVYVTDIITLPSIDHISSYFSTYTRYIYTHIHMYIAVEDTELVGSDSDPRGRLTCKYINTKCVSFIGHWFLCGYMCQDVNYHSIIKRKYRSVDIHIIDKDIYSKTFF